MDLNHLYFQYQVSLIRASTAPDCQARAGHHAAAHGVARRIRGFQQGMKAAAAMGWNGPSLNAATCGGAL